MIVINYTRTGKAFSDFELTKIFYEIVGAITVSQNIQYNTSSSNLISMVFTSISEGILQADFFSFMIDGQEAIVGDHIVQESFDWFDRAVARGILLDKNQIL